MKIQVGTLRDAQVSMSDLAEALKILDDESLGVLAEPHLRMAVQYVRLAAQCLALADLHNARALADSQAAGGRQWLP